MESDCFRKSCVHIGFSSTWNLLRPRFQLVIGQQNKHRRKQQSNNQSLLFPPCLCTCSWCIFNEISYLPVLVSLSICCRAEEHMRHPCRRAEGGAPPFLSPIGGRCGRPIRARSSLWELQQSEVNSICSLRAPGGPRAKPQPYRKRLAHRDNWYRYQLAMWSGNWFVIDLNGLQTCMNVLYKLECAYRPMNAEVANRAETLNCPL